MDIGYVNFSGMYQAAVDHFLEVGSNYADSVLEFLVLKRVESDAQKILRELDVITRLSGGVASTIEDKVKWYTGIFNRAKKEAHTKMPEFLRHYGGGDN